MASDQILRDSAVLWISTHTTFDTTVTPLPANIELFIEKFCSLMSMRPGVASESISGLSQSFSSGEVGSLLKEYARQLIGDEYMLSDVRAIPCTDKWVY